MYTWEEVAPRRILHEALRSTHATLPGSTCTLICPARSESKSGQATGMEDNHVKFFLTIRGSVSDRGEGAEIALSDLSISRSH